jgi:hypothetical protein
MPDSRLRNKGFSEIILLLIVIHWIAARAEEVKGRFCAFGFYH